MCARFPAKRPITLAISDFVSASVAEAADARRAEDETATELKDWPSYKVLFLLASMLILAAANRPAPSNKESLLKSVTALSRLPLPAVGCGKSGNRNGDTSFNGEDTALEATAAAATLGTDVGVNDVGDFRALVISSLNWRLAGGWFRWISSYERQVVT